MAKHTLDCLINLNLSKQIRGLALESLFLSKPSFYLSIGPKLHLSNMGHLSFLRTCVCNCTAENGEIKGSVTGVPASNIADKLWLAFQALGDIAFAYPYSIILLEIEVSFTTN